MGEIVDRPALFAGGNREREAIRLLPWPVLGELGLGERERSERIKGIGGSDANVILSGDADRILGLWREKRGEVESADLGDKFAVMLGCWTEEFNRQWYEKLSGRKVDRLSLALTCPTNEWRRCTLDGYIVETDCIFEAKHTNAFAKNEEVLERYMPQLQHNMAVARVERAVLSVIFGNHKYELFEVASDWIYQIELLQAEAEFWDCVETGRRPVPAVPPAPPKPVGVREVCLEGSNAWAAAAADWLAHREAAKLHAAACSSLKGLVEPDVARAFGHGIEAKRSKAGALSIREIGA
ncbi:YqaJ viral recombinase family protein [Sphingomonas sp. RB56-2]|uniref:YqaJ viral recombinase family protein n=1 Tax=Sphingomonas brevis TaxID=2908206 RepID=A0ABT0SBI8_9SPHN|nr:YqaJ viral recombinase family protein [Sphingomonas brevis]MCL6741455.1 YqaJ viral recombinase family protein [Sphingomonas brevis]